jgi:probable rRNA maturation factor
VNLSLSRSDDVPLQWLDDALVDTLENICRTLEPSDGDVGMVVVDDPYIRGINGRFRGKDRPTDVISFSYLEDADADGLVGEVYISHQTVEREANDLGVDVAHLFLRIAVHGLLHVLGHDHEADDEARRMEERERAILEQHLGPGPAAVLFGFPDD